jgi:acyl carrier protein
MRKDLPGAETDSEQIIDAIRSILYDALSSYERKKIDLWAIDKDTSLRSLPLDSVVMIEIIDSLTERFDTDLRPADVCKASSVGDVIATMK